MTAMVDASKNPPAVCIRRFLRSRAFGVSGSSAREHVGPYVEE